MSGCRCWSLTLLFLGNELLEKFTVFEFCYTGYVSWYGLAICRSGSIAWYCTLLSRSHLSLALWLLIGSFILGMVCLRAMRDLMSVRSINTIQNNSFLRSLMLLLTKTWIKFLSKFLLVCLKCLSLLFDHFISIFAQVAEHITNIHPTTAFSFFHVIEMSATFCKSRVLFITIRADDSARAL